jgi:hypothetical protein
VMDGEEKNSVFLRYVETSWWFFVSFNRIVWYFNSLIDNIVRLNFTAILYNQR